MTGFLSLPISEKPHCLIQSNDEGTLLINRRVLEQIALLNRGLHVVTIAGLYRTGKSYLLNRLAGINKGFPIGSTTEAKTKGIWVWARPHPIYENDILLLIDTEGLGDVEKRDKTNDNWVFALAILLSSTLVYNIMGSFSENYIENLSLVTQMSNYIKTSVSGQNKDDSDFDLSFPLFVLTLRDFSLELKKGDRELTPDEYLEEVCLKARQGKSERELEYDETRLCIRKYFKTRKCFTLDRPGDRDKLKMLENLSDSELSKTFCEDSNKFVKFVLHECPLKMLDNGRAVNGRMFAVMVRSYVQEIRNGYVPCIERAMHVAIENENKLAVENCVEIYKQEMKKSIRLPTPDAQTLSHAHRKCLLEAMTNFLKNSFCDTDERYFKEANEKIMEVYAQCRRNNEIKSAQCCKNALQDLYAKIQKKLEKNEYFRPWGYKEYMADFKELRDKYALLEGLGYKKDEILSNFLEDMNSEHLKVLKADEMMTDRQKEVEGMRESFFSIAGVSIDKERQDQQKERHEDVSRLLNELVGVMIKTYRTDKNNKREHYQAILRKRLAEQKCLHNENCQSEEEQLQKDIRSLQQGIDQEEEKRKNQTKDLEKKIWRECEKFEMETEKEKESSCCII